MKEYIQEMENNVLLAQQYELKLSECEKQLQLKFQESQSADNHIELVKKLHVEQCSELQQQVEKLSQMLEIQTALANENQTKYSQVDASLKEKEVNLNVMKKELFSCKQTLEEKMDVISKYENNIEV